MSGFKMRLSILWRLVAWLFALDLVSSQLLASQRYAPSLRPCPHEINLVRHAGTHPRKQRLNKRELHYVSTRRTDVLPAAWTSYVHHVQQSTPDVTFPRYVKQILHNHFGDDAFPNLGIATSGGGLRAAIFGAGVLSALDGRNQTSRSAGTGGLLQAASYISGLSGGSWLVLSLAEADFPKLPHLIFGSRQLRKGTGRRRFGGWLTEVDILQPSIEPEVLAAFQELLVQETVSKFAAGFPVTITDAWGRTLGRHFVNGTTAHNFDRDSAHGAGVTLSSVQDVPSFRSHSQPFPIVVADSINNQPNTSAIIDESGVVVPLGNPIYEFNVYEFGSFDPSLGAFIPMKHLGSPNSSVCARGFDRLSFIEGVSSNLFNTFNTSLEALMSSVIGPIVSRINEIMPQPGIRLDSAVIPNPFFELSEDTFVDSGSTHLTLVDGGEDAETTPFQPLLVRARNVDTIIAIDAPADTLDNFADGSSLIATKKRSKLLHPAYPFPHVPATQKRFLKLGLTTRPTFFGCNDNPSSAAPLVIYIANGGPPLGQSPQTNASTSQLSFTHDQVQAALDQVFDIATQGIPVLDSAGVGQKDPMWPACLACAVVDRARRRLGIDRSGVCVQCLERYCFS